MRKYLIGLLSFLLIVSMVPLSGSAVETQEHDVDLWNAVKPLETTVTFLNTGAHPDDERSDFLAYLSRGLGVTTASLIANRGEGGQNEIGNELGNALGIIRSREMIEAAKITGVTAYHLSETTSDDIYDFGFSKSPDETLGKWGEDETYERLIRFIRTYQPDIVMPSFRNDHSQHGHH
ncbi:MAG: PIG-L family deacetylase, partial [Mesobacillus sp.]|uniref:PIG-L family deacetylase n=1 Tax=Mesobacillus sp. TaxID=2675271 RepID=UPI003C4893E9